MLTLLLIAQMAVPLVLFRLIRKQSRTATFAALDLGMVFTLIASLYAILPLIGFILYDLNFGKIYDIRLTHYGADYSDPAVVRVAALFLIFSASFATSYYLAARNKLNSLSCPGLNHSALPDACAALSAVLLVVAIGGALLALRSLLDIKYTQDYASSYLELNHLPLLARQLYQILSSMFVSALMLAIVAVIAYKPKLHRWILVAIVAHIAVTFILGRSRSFAFFNLLTYLVARSLYDKQFSLRYLFIVATGGFVAFLLAGMIRGYIQAGAKIPGYLYLFQGGEFFIIFNNALDVQRRIYIQGIDFPKISFYLFDLLRFIPSQIAGAIKISPADYYMSTFYPWLYKAGYGFAFGAIAESIVGTGWPDALVRGILLGVILAKIRNACLKPDFSLTRAFVYTWFVVYCFYSIRDTTFSIFQMFVFYVLPTIIIGKMTGILRQPGVNRLNDAHSSNNPQIITKY